MASLLRYLRKPAQIPDISICIPAYNAEKFIDRTIRFALGQTYPRLRVLISVDKSDDDTAGVCRQFAAADSRITVFEHATRQGWCANVNSLLDAVDTEFFFIYFHDDVLLPQYCASLRAALLARPDAASANCDLYDFGLIDALRPGCSYEGRTAHRLLTLWSVQHRGTLLRAMVRRDRIDGRYRLPPEEPSSFVPGQTLLARVVAAGPSVHVAETLYLRWNRKGSLTDVWRELPINQVLSGWKGDLANVFALIDELVADPADRSILKFAQLAYVSRILRNQYRFRNQPPPPILSLHPDASIDIDLRETQSRFGREIAAGLSKMRKELAVDR